MQSLRRFLSLSAADRRLVLAALGAVLSARILLWIAPYRRLRALLERTAGRHGDPGQAWSRERIAWAVQATGRAVPGASCLAQALAAEWLLRRAGHPATLALGVARDAGGVLAHAWLQSGGRTLVGADECEAFVPLEPNRARRSAGAGPVSRGENVAAAVRPEHELLLYLARTRRDPAAEQRIGELLGRPLCWETVLTQAERHAVLPVIGRRLAGRFREAVPPDVRARLRDAAVAAAADALRLAGELLRVLDRLAAGGIQAIPFKGPLLAWQLYGSCALRQFSDLDCLIRRGDVRLAAEILCGLGYRAPACTPAQAQALFGHGCTLVLSREGGVWLELHWAVTGAAFPVDLEYDQMWERVQPVVFQGRSVLCLAPEDLLTVLCIHGAKHAWGRLRWVADVAELLRREPGLNWDALIRRAERSGHRRILRWGLAVAGALLDAPLPESVRQWIGCDPAVGSLARAAEAALFDPTHPACRTVALSLRAREGWRAKAMLLRGAAVAVGPADWQAVSLPDRLFWLYYAIRPVRLLGRHLLFPQRGGAMPPSPRGGSP